MEAGESDQSHLMKFVQLAQGNDATPQNSEAPAEVNLQPQTFGCDISGPFEYVGTLEVSTEVIPISNDTASFQICGTKWPVPLT